ncbi:DUF6093 family protein [Nocardioides sp. PD653]|uniref:DUF6093 family protein n=1 Tax=Nocardioides sp. PD653 TaxID=393303 RepID=UPI0009F0BE05|nr:DUF6093 family protein [Nocardioides sp. PD653]GAW54742.1 uncharacterized protein PD653_2156 [Nocardioides sp. PD653]
MRPTRSQGRPGTPVVPVDWAASHRPVAEATMLGTCSLRHPGTTEDWSDELEQMVEVPLAPYAADTPCRVQALATQARPVVTAGDREVVAQYLVTVPAHLFPYELDLVTVTGSGDALLDDQTLLVVQVVRGTERFERDMFCSLDA